MKLKELLGKELIFFDGAMGTMLQKRGLNTGELPEIFNITHPEVIKEIHGEYLNSGADVIITNTFGANEYKLKNCKYSVEEVIKAAVSIAKEVKGEKYVALDIGPIGELIEPMGTLTFDETYEAFKRQVIAGRDAGVDIILIETMSDIYETKAAVLAAKENSKLPIFCTMTFTEEGRTFTGTDPITAVSVLEGLKVDVLGVNCSLGPKEVLPVIKEIAKYSSTPIMVQPNAGLPKIVEGKTVYDISSVEFATFVKALVKEGVSIIGGCCGTTPEYIKECVSLLKKEPLIEITKKEFSLVSSSTNTVLLGKSAVVIGERINPTGKKNLKEALKEENVDYILKEAVLQKEAGAEILDVNVGLPDINEEKTMLKVMKEIQATVNLPLQLDSSDYRVFEKAVRYYNGKPIINSVNGKRETMEAIFPIVKKYGACVIGLTLDENGIPNLAEERFNIGKKIIKTAKEFGIDKKDIIIDCLVLTASAAQKDVLETIKAIKLVKEGLGVKTVLGVSNISFGLPRREILNRTYLSMALTLGLDTAIIDPLNEDMMETIRAFRLLSNMDGEGKEYITHYGQNITKKVKREEKLKEGSLEESIINGFKEQAIASAIKLLKSEEPLFLVNNRLIPSLDKVGILYEEGTIFLPQLIQSAEAVKGVFELIKEILKSRGEEKISKGKIILATVKGDVHDIGKNIVKVLLENYGYEVIDLGKDVERKLIVEAAIKNNVKLVGLSALMTTTVKNMEETIKALREAGASCKVVVGGAVLNSDYAKMIGADFYAKDASETVEIARKIYN